MSHKLAGLDKDIARAPLLYGKGLVYSQILDKSRLLWYNVIRTKDKIAAEYTEGAENDKVSLLLRLQVSAKMLMGGWFTIG